MNRAEIETACQVIANRQDLSADFNTYFPITESRIANSVNIFELQVVQNIAIADSLPTYPLPADYQKMRAFRVDGQPLLGVPVGLFPLYSNESQLIAYTIEDNTIKGNQSFQGKAAEIQYYKKSAPLVAATDTNEISDKYPDLYIYSLLIDISLKLQDESNYPAFRREFAIAKDEASKRSWWGLQTEAPQVQGL